MTWTETEGGWALDPPLELVDADTITLGQIEEGCALLEIDPDAVFSGGEVQIPDVPPWPETKRFFALVVENADAYDLDAMPVGRVRALLAILVDHFGTACRVPSGAPISA
jgi:hypothetical protein